MTSDISLEVSSSCLISLCSHVVLCYKKFWLTKKEAGHWPLLIALVESEKPILWELVPRTCFDKRLHSSKQRIKPIIFMLPVIPFSSFTFQVEIVVDISSIFLLLSLSLPSIQQIRGSLLIFLINCIHHHYHLLLPYPSYLPSPFFFRWRRIDSHPFYSFLSSFSTFLFSPDGSSKNLLLPPIVWFLFSPHLSLSLLLFFIAGRFKGALLLPTFFFSYLLLSSQLRPKTLTLSLKSRTWWRVSRSPFFSTLPFLFLSFVVVCWPFLGRD